MNANFFALLSVVLISLSNCTPVLNQEDNKAFRTFVESAGSQFDIWIKDGTIISGLDSPGFIADILVKGTTIQFVGKVDTSLFEAELEIDANKKVVTPGFIDTHAHGNPLKTPNFRNFLSMGVTSICLGQDGSSPNYRDLSIWMQQVEEHEPAVNIIPFVGHGTLRKLSGVGYQRVPSTDALNYMKTLLESALEAGAFGMTTGLEYTPGVYAEDAELLSLAQTVGQYDGMIMSHIRNEDDNEIQSALEELIRQGAFCNIHVSHLKIVYGKNSERAQEILQLLRSENISHRITADIYPYNASFTGIGILFPEWAKPPNNYASVYQKRKKELLDFLRNKVIARNGPEATLFGTAPYKGRTLAQISEEKGLPFEEVVANIGPTGASGAYFVMNEDVQDALFLDPKVMVCSDGSPTMYHPRGYGSFAKIIQDHVNRKKLLSLERAVHKMTSLPAATLGLKDRGSIEPGYMADLLIFDPSQIQANANYIEPHALASGFDWIIVNGGIAMSNGQLKGKRFGKVLRKE